MENDIKPMNILDNGTGSRMCELYSGIRDTGSDLKRIWKQTEEKMLLSEGCGFVNDGTKSHMVLRNSGTPSRYKTLTVEGKIRIGSFVSESLNTTLTAQTSIAQTAFYAVFAGVMYDESVTHRDETTMSGMVVPVTEIVREPVFNLVLKKIEDVSESQTEGYSGNLIPPKTTAFLSSSEERDMILHKTVGGNNVYIADTEGYEKQPPGEGKIRTGACCCLGCFMVKGSTAEFVALRHGDSFISGFENETFLGKSVRTKADITSDGADKNAVYTTCLKCLDIPSAGSESSDYGVHIMTDDVTEGIKITKNGIDIQKTELGNTSIACLTGSYIGFSDLSDDHDFMFKVGPNLIEYYLEDYLTETSEGFRISNNEFYIGELFGGKYTSDSNYNGHFGTIDFKNFNRIVKTTVEGDLSVSDSLSANVVRAEKVCDSGNNVIGGFKPSSSGSGSVSHIGTISLLRVVKRPVSSSEITLKHPGETFVNGEQGYSLSIARMNENGEIVNSAYIDEQFESGKWQSLVDFTLGQVTVLGESILRGYMLAIRIA